MIDKADTVEIANEMLLKGEMEAGMAFPPEVRPYIVHAMSEAVIQGWHEAFWDLLEWLREDDAADFTDMDGKSWADAIETKFLKPKTEIKQ